MWTGATDDPARCCDLWAPELHQVGDHWYVYYAADDGTASHHALQVLESADPLGPYHFKNTLTGGALSTDPTVLDQGGTHFLLWSKDLGDGTSGLAISAMSNAWTLTGTPTVISRPTNSWETVGQAVDEGPSVLQRDGKLFVTFAASSCGSADQALGMLSFTPHRRALRERMDEIRWPGFRPFRRELGFRPWAEQLLLVAGRQRGLERLLRGDLTRRSRVRKLWCGPFVASPESTLECQRHAAFWCSSGILAIPDAAGG
nr:family 43 glycosylhydrolase [Fodinicola feengrottensis]